MLTDAQKAVRRGGLGSSDIGAVAGLSPYARPIDVWLVKRGLAEVAETDAMRLGTALEPVIADLYAREHVGAQEILAAPGDVWRGTTDGTLAHPAEPWALATPDRAELLAGSPEPDRAELLAGSPEPDRADHEGPRPVVFDCAAALAGMVAA